MKCFALTLAGCLAALTMAAPSAQADFGLHGFDATFTNQDGTTATQAGAHPYAFTTQFGVNFHEEGEKTLVDGRIRDVLIKQIQSLVADPSAYPRCSSLSFLARAKCPTASQVGITASSSDLLSWRASPVYNLGPPPGTLIRLGWNIGETANIVIDIGLTQDPPYVGLVASRNTPQPVDVVGFKAEIWGDPASSAHDALRGECLEELAHNTTEPGSTGEPLPLDAFDEYTFEGTGALCSTPPNPKPFLTLPTSCNAPLISSFEALSWQGAEDFGSALTHNALGEPQAFTGCGKLAFKPSTSAVPTSKAATSPTGLDYALEIADEGLTSPAGLAQSDVEKVEVTLPEGMSVNPSQAEGLEVCSEAQLAAETLQASPGEGCPPASKIGSVVATSPLVPEEVPGSLYVAKPYENLAGNSLLALYLVVKNPKIGVIVKQPLRVENDPVTGRITTVAEEVIQVPISSFKLHFREGTRSPLVTPPACGHYEVASKLYPSSGTAPVTSTSTFEVISGPDNGSCPSGGLPPFHPELSAGTLNNAAGAFSPFNVKITRNDSEQEITHFSIKLPPGVAGKLAGIPFCSDAAIARAASRTGPHGGTEELDDPSCPAASQVGRTLAGAGVGPSLAYAPGKVYLAGPYHGSPISLVSITSGVVGPFDIGTVVVRLAVQVNPETGEVFLDSTGSDPIPHIIEGIPVHLRDIRAYTDRPEFTFNPTSCERKSTAATVLGSGLDFVSPADDRPFVSTSPFQAADCAALPFAPKLTLRLLGGTKRGDYPKLKAFLRMRGFGEAGVARAQVTLPRSEFIANAHFDTICTRVQFKQLGGNGEACPKGSIYGWARAKTPILAEPLEGPVFLRSSEHQLPDVVASLRGQEINVHLVGHVDSVKGQLRNTFETVPDAPVEWASFSFKGASKGLFENSTNLCARKHRALVKFTGQNGKRHNYSPAVKVKCGGKGKRA